MKQPILIIFILLLRFQVNAQFSASLGYRYSNDGVDFNQNNFNLTAHWKQPRRFQFSVGFEFTPKFIDYSSTNTQFYYDHGPPGYSNSATHTYVRSSKASYLFMKAGLFFDWSIIETNEFELLAGFHIQFGGAIYQNESGHETIVSHHYSSEWAGEYSSYSEVDPVSYEAFDAIRMCRGNGNLGVKISPRYYFNQSFVQLDMTLGRMVQRMYYDEQGQSCGYSWSTCFEYDYLFKREHPYYVSLGFTIGRCF